jgi:hypothetical protein
MSGIVRKSRFAMSQEPVQAAQTHSSPKALFERMIQAANRHDLDVMVAYFAPDFAVSSRFTLSEPSLGQQGCGKTGTSFSRRFQIYRLRSWAQRNKETRYGPNCSIGGHRPMGRSSFRGE